jgi:nucleoside-triphosphatase
MQKTVVFILSGKQGEGKTTKLQEVVALLKPEIPDIFGFYALGNWENGLRKSFQIVSVKTGEQHLLCQRKGRSETSKGFFEFYRSAVFRGEQWINTGIEQNGRLCVLDEIGRFELEQRVWYHALQEILQSQTPLLFTVRESLTDQVLRYFSIQQVMIFNVSNASRQIADRIKESLSI